MNVAFICQINLDDLTNLPDVSREIEEVLGNAGFEVKHVAPWQRPALKEQGLFQPEQTTLTPTIETIT